MCTTKIVKADEIMNVNKNIKDPLEEYQPPRKIKNREYIEQITAVKLMTSKI